MVSGANILELLKKSVASAMWHALLSHDLAVVRSLADRVAYFPRRSPVCWSSRRFFSPPHHPYTLSLLEAVPRIERSQSNLKPVARVSARTFDQNVPMPAAAPFNGPDLRRKRAAVAEQSWRVAIRCHIPIADLTTRATPDKQRKAREELLL